MLSNKHRRTTIFRIWFVALLLTPFVLWFLPATFFDEGDALCPSRRFLGLECLGCGMTRAVMHFHHFDFPQAFFYNYGVIVVYPALGILWFIWILKAWREANFS